MGCQGEGYAYPIYLIPAIGEISDQGAWVLEARSQQQEYEAEMNAEFEAEMRAELETGMRAELQAEIGPDN
jgi:hypothetical protein